MASESNHSKPGRACRIRRLPGWFHSAEHLVFSSSEEFRLVAHSYSASLVEHDCREWTELPSRDAALLGYIKYRES
jgi:hypothetical protein